MALEWYVLDDSLRRSQVIEKFNSFIWTERYSAYGDFQIVTQSTFQNRQLLSPKTWIGKKDSYYVAQVDTVADSTDDTGARTITVTGKFVEALLLDRVAMPNLVGTAITPNWVLTAKPADIANEMFTQICVVGTLNQQDTIPFYQFGTLLPPGSIPMPDSLVTISAAPDMLYNTIKQICDTYGMGFRIVKNGDLSELYFEIYTGNDLTSSQIVRNPVIFDPAMDNLSNISMVTSTASTQYAGQSAKTVAYVFAQNGTAVVYAPGASPEDSGTDRRVLLINSSNTDAAGPTLTAALQQEGVQGLAAATPIFSFDGELPPTVPYIYGVDYNLGDVVEERNSDGVGNQMIVTEQIFTSDDTGEHAYPTLALYQTITPDTWISQPATETWATVDPTLVWADA